MAVNNVPQIAKEEVTNKVITNKKFVGSERGYISNVNR